MIDLNQYKNGFFATREGIDDALEYAAEVAAGSADSAAVYTALHVVLNTVIAAVEKSAQPARVELSEGVQVAIAQKVAEAIDAHAEGLQDRVGELVQEWIDENLQDRVGDATGEWLDENLSDRLQGEGLCEAIRDAFRNNLQINIA